MKTTIIATIMLTVASTAYAAEDVPPRDVAQKIFDHCKRKWIDTEPTPNHGMVAYCLEKETESWKKIQQFRNKTNL